MADENGKRQTISRRDLLRTAGAAGAAALIPGSVAAEPTGGAAAAGVAGGATPAAGVAGAATAAPTAAATAAPAGPLMNLTAQETEVLAAIVDRLIPSDELGPGAIEAGALRFIDRALSEAESGQADAYRAGLAALDRYSRYARGAPFLELSARDQDSVLVDCQIGSATGAGVGFEGSSAGFFNMVKSHTWQGTFGDPQYGGNVNFIGWDLIRYPGLRMRVTDDDQRRLEADELEPVRRSAYDFGQFQAGARDTGGQG
ncbi:MAG TPA: gluconate 2-dehydrogenase subunit 3 family protein [Longimicrobiales bacterium]|nr:gluconate 2-dehydrogenase subunit 3 family protein [Longimicrobiales bacterium]